MSNATDTFPTYQPLAPGSPVTEEVIVSGEGSATRHDDFVGRGVFTVSPAPPVRPASPIPLEYREPIVKVLETFTNVHKERAEIRLELSSQMRDSAPCHGHSGRGNVRSRRFTSMANGPVTNAEGRLELLLLEAAKLRTVVLKDQENGHYDVASEKLRTMGQRLREAGIGRGAGQANYGRTNKGVKCL